MNQELIKKISGASCVDIKSNVTTARRTNEEGDTVEFFIGSVTGQKFSEATNERGPLILKSIVAQSSADNFEEAQEKALQLAVDLLGL